MLHAELSSELLRTIFTPRSALHDGAVLVRGDQVVAAGIVLPLGETSIQAERLGTRHRAAVGITEQTDAVVVVVRGEWIDRARRACPPFAARRGRLGGLAAGRRVWSGRPGQRPGRARHRSLRPPRRLGRDRRP